MRQKKYILKQIAIICTAAFLFTGCGKADKSYDKGMEYIESEDYGKALKCFEEAISENADKAEYYIGAGMAYNYLGRYEEAVEKFSHAFQESENTISNTNNKQLYYGDTISKYGLAKYDEAIEDCKKALNIKQVDSLDEKINLLLGVSYQAADNYTEAQKIYDSIIKSDKKNTKAYIARASLFVEVKDYESAAKDYTKAMDTDEECDDAYFGLYNVYILQKDEESAKSILNKLIDMDSDDKKHDIASGKAYYYLGEYDNALAAFKKAVKNGEQDALYFEGMTYVAKSDYNSAKKLFKEYISKEDLTKNIDAYVQISNCLIEVEDYEQALTYVQKGLDLGETSVQKSLLKNNVIIYEKMGLYKKAYSVAGKYVKLYPDDKKMKRELTFIRTRI